VPLLLGIADGMRALRFLLNRREFWNRETLMQPGAPADPPGEPLSPAFITMREKLVAAGVPVVATQYVASEQEAIAAARALGMPVALKAEAPDLLHKSDIGCVRLNCASEKAVAEAYRDVVDNAAKAGFAKAGVLVQPMTAGVAEAYAGVICDPTFGSALVFGLGGIFVEVLKDTVTEMAPLTRDDAMRMISGIKGAPLLYGARGRPRADVEALASLLVALGRFAAENSGRFAALDINPIIVKAEGEGVFAVDIALDTGSGVGRPDSGRH
jgi:succinyl-CoA synthetase beta subunit